MESQKDVKGVGVKSTHRGTNQSAAVRYRMAHKLPSEVEK